MSRPPRVETGNVLSDIDNMLQDLTDELDAMLKEETSAWKVMLIFGRIFVQNMILVYQRGEDMLDYKMVSTASFLHQGMSVSLWSCTETHDHIKNGN